MTYKVDGACLPVEFLVMGSIDNNVYFIGDGDTVIVVDPTCDAPRIVSALRGRTVGAIVLTHRHWDHVGAARDLRKATGATVVASRIDAPWITGEKKVRGESHPVPPCPVDHLVDHGDVLQIGSMPWKVIGTPGHTPGSICLYIDPRFGTNPQGAPLLVSGDTLFYGAIGRTDFVGGNFEAMCSSLKRLAVLRDNTIVLPGHGELTTIGAERRRVFARYAPAEPEGASEDDERFTC